MGSVTVQAGGGAPLDVRRFAVTEAMSSPFVAEVWAVSPRDDLDLEQIVGRPAVLATSSEPDALLHRAERRWSGVCAHVEQLHAEDLGDEALSTYYLRIVPALWLAGHRTNHRLFQHQSVPDITGRLLAEWGVPAAWRIDGGQYPRLECRIQYGESDLAFLSRLWEEAGIAYSFEDSDAGPSLLVLSDRPHEARPRARSGLSHADNSTHPPDREIVTRVTLSHEVRPGAFAIRDHDFRNPTFPLFGAAPRVDGLEAAHEVYRYLPGAFLVEGGKGGGTPVADDKGVARHEASYGHGLSARSLESLRTGQRSVTFKTNVGDLSPGATFHVEGHPHPALAAPQRLLVVRAAFAGGPGLPWTFSGEAVFAAAPYRPSPRTEKPRVHGVQSAVVVGPKGQEIHTDEYGRVRVQFPWDREGSMDEGSSPWIRVSHGWAGTGYGMIVVPRVGQEVLVGFEDGDPDRPIVVGRVFNAPQQVPFRLPEHKTRSTWRSDSSPGSDGYNEIMFEDLKGRELVYLQAQKNLRKLVKHDETITVLHDRQKYVLVNEIETTGLDRVEVTGVDRTEITGALRTTVIGGSLQKLVAGDETEKTDGDLQVFVGGDQDTVVHGAKRERIEGDSHLSIKGERRQHIGSSQSLTIGRDQQEKVGRYHALEAGTEIHLQAGTAIVIEAPDITFRGAGGFIRIDAGGVTIKGNLVKINSGGSPGAGAGSHPEAPEQAAEAEVEPPRAPEPDNVAVTGLAQ